MDRIRTLLLARTHMVVMDPDQVANAATRPTRDTDVDKFEDELAQLGYVMSLDLAMTIRRLPYQAIQDLRHWMFATLAKQRSDVPAPLALGAAADRSIYMRRILTWLAASPHQPCPWCGEIKAVGALDPCGHLVCRTCWDGGSFSGCPICHRRVAVADPLVQPGRGEAEALVRHSSTLTLLHLGFDLLGAARARFERLLARTTPLSPDDRGELEATIDAIGPKVVGWLPPRIPVKETNAVVIARLWMVAPDRAAMVRSTAVHLRNATDVLRVAVVVMGGHADLAEPMRLRSIGRRLRRAILDALDAQPFEQTVEELGRHAGLWKRVGERLHPFEWAGRLPNAALAFAIVRETNLQTASFGAALREHAAQLSYLRVTDDIVRPIAWASPIEQALRSGNPRSALARLTHRPGELLRRADHLVRAAQTHQIDALGWILKAIQIAATRGSSATLLALSSHVARRGARWPRRVFFPRGEILRAWGTEDRRQLLRGDAIGAIVIAIRTELVARAAMRRNFPRAVIDRALGDLPVPIHEPAAAAGKLAWPRGSELPLPAGRIVRLFLHCEERVELDLAATIFDARWRHVATCDGASPSVGHADRPAVVHAAGLIDLDLEQLQMLGARHLVMVVSSSRPAHGFVGLMVPPAEAETFEPHAVEQRFDLRRRSSSTVALTIDLGERGLRWLDVPVTSRRALHHAGGYRAGLAHVGRDFGDLAMPHARPTLWDVACIHAAARANIVYVRERDGSFTTYRRRDGEGTVPRLARLLSATGDDGRLATIPTTDAPTWVAIIRGDLALPRGSAGFVLDGRGLGSEVERNSATQLVAELVPR